MPITNVFVLMLENRSFDHMLGFSGITGIDADTGQQTSVEGPGEGRTNVYAGVTYPVISPAVEPMTVDPGHEFNDVVMQLCGETATYPGIGYPPIDNSGFVANYVRSDSPNGGKATSGFGDIILGFTAEQLPVLNALARAYAVCDNWYSSMPGPTWPNRFFAHAASSGGLDDSPSGTRITEADTLYGFPFSNGTIFDRLKVKGVPFRIYAGGTFPGVAGLKGISASRAISIDSFTGDVAQPTYPQGYTFIEPNYGDVVNSTFINGSSQHPMDTVRGGEALIKQVYDAITRSPRWATSLLIVTWDEHGGFYDHQIPPIAVSPGDTPIPGNNVHGFNFEQLGVRVPAVIVSPLIPAGTIDHRPYEHSSIPKTIEDVYDLEPLTQRDRAAPSVTRLLTPILRTDIPQLPEPADTAVPLAASAPSPDAPIDGGPMPAYLHVAMQHDLEQSPTEAHPAIQTRVANIRTYGQAAQYIAEVQSRVRLPGTAA